MREKRGINVEVFFAAVVIVIIAFFTKVKL